MLDSETPISEADITEKAASGEGVLAVLGAELLTANISLESLGKCLLVLTDKNIYQAGIRLIPKGEKGFKKVRGANSFPVDELRSVEIIEHPIPDWIGLLGWFLLLGGIAVMGAAFAHGGGFVIAIALFLGPVWMSVPGSLLIAYAKKEKNVFLRFAFSDHEFAVSGSDYSEDELVEFEKRCVERIGT